MRRGLVIVLLLSGILLLPTNASAKVPRGFYGVVSQAAPLESDFEAMRRGNVGTLRFAVPWPQVESAPGAYDWSQVDAIVAGAAASGIELLPFTYGTPTWLAGDGPAPVKTERQRSAWEAFHLELAARYGRGGTFWTGRAEYAPITQWQPWNEPNLSYFWGSKPSAREYARMLRIASRAIHEVDPRARIVMAGLAPGRGQLPWEFLRNLYGVPRIERHFDAVAFHPYARGIADMRYLLERMRSAIRAAGERRMPLEITEVSWGSGGPRGYPLVTTPKGQARMLRKSFRMLRSGKRRWRIRQVDWFSWADGTTADPACLWCEHAGLFTLDRRPKPAWRAFKRLTAR
jgi:Beta-galactosidase